MIPAGRIRRLRIRILLLLPTFLSLSCGSTDFAGGGTGGTGISTGAVSGYGSVVVNGVHFKTDNEVAPGFHTKKISNGSDKSRQMDRDVFSVGMVVTVRHGTADNNAQVIEYRRNLLGPVAKKFPGVDNVLEILGLSVVVDEPAKFDSLEPGDIVEVSGFADNAGRIRAGYIFPVPPPMPPPFQEFDVKGFVSKSSSNRFHLGPLPDGSGLTVMVSYPPGGPANGTFVEVVTTDREPVGGVITATRIEKLASRTEFPDGTPVELEGLVTMPWSGSMNDFSFAVEGKRVQWDANTEFVGGARNDTQQTNRRVQVQGTETGGFLSAVRIVFR